MEHFVIIDETCEDGEVYINILGVTHSLEEARYIFKNDLLKAWEYASEHNFKIYDKKIAFFDAGTSENYNQNHTKIYIVTIWKQ